MAGSVRRVHPDKRVVDRMLAGDRQTFDSFFEESMPRLYRFTASRVGNDPDLVADIVQTAMSKAIDRLENYRGESALLSWLVGFCKFEMLNHFKKKKVAPMSIEVLEENPAVRLALESRGDLLDPEQVTQGLELSGLVHAALDQLPERQGQALEWKYSEGLSVEEISVRLGVGQKAAESVLSRARVGFREAFSKLESAGSGSAGRTPGSREA